MARSPRKNIPFGPARSAACLTAAWVVLILWLLLTWRIFSAALVLIVGSVFGPHFLMRGLGNAPLARRVLKSFLTANTNLMFGVTATVIAGLLSVSLRDFAVAGTVPEIFNPDRIAPIGFLLLLTMFSAGFSAGIVRNTAKLEENRIVRLFRKPIHRSAATVARKIAAPNALIAAILFPVCLWVLIVDKDLIPPNPGIIIALVVLACSVACLLLFWLYLLPRLYFVASRLLWRQIKRGN